MLALLADKALSYVVLTLSALMIAQREKKEEAASFPGNYSSPNDVSQTGSSSSITQSPRQVELFMFSPAARYLTNAVSQSSGIYGGLPRWMWRGGVLFKLMKEVKKKNQPNQEAS